MNFRVVNRLGYSTAAKKDVPTLCIEGERTAKGTTYFAGYPFGANSICPMGGLGTAVKSIKRRLLQFPNTFNC